MTFNNSVVDEDSKKKNKIKNFRDYLTRLIDNYDINKSNNHDLVNFLIESIDKFYVHITSNTELNVNKILENIENNISYSSDNDELYNRNDVEFVDALTSSDDDINLELYNNQPMVIPEVSNLNDEAIKRLNMFINDNFEEDKVLLWKENNTVLNCKRFINKSRYY